MFPQLPALGKIRRISVSGVFFGTRVTGLVAVAGRVLLMELLGTVRPFEFMTFTGNARHSNGHQQEGEKFHRGAS